MQYEPSYTHTVDNKWRDGQREGDRGVEGTTGSKWRTPKTRRSEDSPSAESRRNRRGDTTVGQLSSVRSPVTSFLTGWFLVTSQDQLPSHFRVQSASHCTNPSIFSFPPFVRAVVKLRRVFLQRQTEEAGWGCLLR